MNIKQIANIAGVSVATVSRVLNHPENVATKTRQKVENIISQEEYTPNWFARGLNFNKTSTIGLLIPHILDEVNMEIAKGVEDVAEEKGYITFMCDTEEKEEKERKYLQQLINRRVDGLIIISTVLGKEELEFLMKEKIPTVLVGNSKTNPGLNVVSVDCKEGTKKAISHMVKAGHKNMGILYGEKSNVENIEKIEGYKEALIEADLALNKKNVIKVEDTIEGGYLATKKIIEKKDFPDAIFTTSDRIAFGAMDAIKSNGLKIPEDVALVGFGNVRLSSLVEPKLTTIDMPKHKMGVYGARLLFDIIEGEEESKQKEISLKTKLKVRKSCGHKERIGEMF